MDVLYDVIKSKKHRTWQKIHEPIMLKYLELCVDLRKSHLAKEGLYQYKNICQQVCVSSREEIRSLLLHFTLHAGLYRGQVFKIYTARACAADCPLLHLSVNVRPT